MGHCNSTGHGSNEPVLEPASGKSLTPVHNLMTAVLNIVSMRNRSNVL